MFRKLAIAAATVGALSGAAQATVYNWDAHDVIELTLIGGPGAGGLVLGAGGFLDNLVFTLSSAATLNSTAVTNNQAPLFGISGGKYAIVTAGSDGIFGNDNDIPVSDIFDYSGVTGDIVHSVTLAAGTYAYAVGGEVSGVGGIYLLSSTIAPVPEPETLSLMLAGAGLLGFMAKRRRKA